MKKKEKLSPDEIAMIRRHPEISAKILGQMGESFQWLAEVALQIHERSDGSGYPKGLRGKEIYELSSIIGMVDVYMAMIKRRPYRDKLVQTDVIKYIIKDARALFPPRIMKVFLNLISLFPVNTYVRLNNNSIGRVRSTDIKHPLRPTIELISDGRGGKTEKREVINLSKNPLLFIVESVRDRELPNEG